jgi:hypothetical protein
MSRSTCAASLSAILPTSLLLAALSAAQPARAQPPSAAPRLLLAAQASEDRVRVPLRDEAGVIRAYMAYSPRPGRDLTDIVFTDAQGKPLNLITSPRIPPPPAAAANPLAGPPLPKVVVPPGPRPTANCEKCDANDDLLQRQITALRISLQGIVDRLNAARVK